MNLQTVRVIPLQVQLFDLVKWLIAILKTGANFLGRLGYLLMPRKDIPVSNTTEPGLYRVRALDHQKLVYIGQTGRNLRERTRALSLHTYRSVWYSVTLERSAYRCSRPWAIRFEDGLSYEKCRPSSSYEPFSLFQLVSVPRLSLPFENSLVWIRPSESISNLQGT